MSDRWRVLPRHRLVRCLEDALPTGVALIVAPLGSGKTTLLEQWSGRSTRPVHWVDTSGPIDLHPLTVAISTSTGPPGSITVVIDDAHGIASHDMEVVEHFIERSTPHATILIASRTMPAFNLAHREFPTPVLITGEALRFRPREVAALFRDVYGTTLDPAAAAQLAHDTDGWAAALHLHHLGLGSRTGRPGSATAARTTNDQYLQDYLSREVLRPLPPPLVEFLRLTSVFDTVTPGRCDELLGWTGSRKVLMELTRREGLVRRDPFDPDCFHYNRVLRDHLRIQLREQLGAETVRTVRALAIDVLVRAQAPGEEATARARAADWPGLSSLLRVHGALLTRPDMSTWLDLLPPDVRDHDPWFMLATARRLLADGRPEDCERTARQAASQMVDREGARLCEDVVAEALRWAGGAAGSVDDPLAAWAAEPEAARLLSAVMAVLIDSADPAEALDAVHADSLARGETWMARIALTIGLIRDGAGQGIDAALRVAAERRAVGDPAGAFLLECAVALTEFRAGHPDLTLLEKLTVRARGLGSVPGVAWLSSGLALAVANADLPEASAAASSAEALARASGVAGAHATAYAALAIVKPGSRTDLLELARELSVTPVGRSAGPGPRGHVHAGAGPVGTHGSSRTIRPWEWLSGPAERLRAPPPEPSPTASALEVSVRCLGSFDLTIHQVQVNLAEVRPVARGVLRALAIRAGTPVHRDWLVEQFWPTLRPAAGIHNLHVAICALRRSLEPHAPGRSHTLLARGGDTYTFARSLSLVTDLQRVMAQLRIARELGRDGDPAGQGRALSSALELYTDDVLPDDGAAEWALQIREHARLSVAQAAIRLCALCLRAGSADAAIAAAERAVALDRWNDSAWRALIAAHTRADDPVATDQVRHSYHLLLESIRGDEHDSRRAVERTTGHLIPLDPGQERLKKASSPTASRRFDAAP
ncbi:BTAD domain-containing putative transcriptional regulator [Humibacillus sp. DSM 29435]|uniref:BTAD domain-containing putative transcriptional regulator n=1 Tax=Humibacillus sp. DSM 29435 TaxID=1869167 RepID=UPI000A70FFBB|nr:BTAD domain-containing putative transcriptional regulator [Humibacillus sp. DSM 29435]